MLATTLLGAGAFVFLAPGLACLARMPGSLEWPEHLLYGFAISYSWVFVLSIVLPLAGWTVNHAAIITTAFVAIVVPWGNLIDTIRRATRSTPPSVTGVLLGAAVVMYAAGAWFVEPPLHGDAALDLTSVSRFADGGPIHFDNTSIVPHTRATYIFQPYQLALGMTARASNVDAVVAFEKIRPLLVLLSLVFVFLLLKQLTVTHAHAIWAFTVVLVFVGLDMATWQDKSLYPVVQRGGVAAGLCVPVLMTLILAATRRAEPQREARRRLAMRLASIFLVAFMCTHALEVYTALFFAAAVGVGVVIGADHHRVRARVWQLGIAFAVVLALYLPVHARALPDLTAYEDQLKASLRAEFARDYPTVASKLTGGMGQEEGDLLAHRLPATTAAVIGVPALLAAVFIAPGGATAIALATAPLALLFASPAGYVALALATSADSVQETTAYFALLGLLAVSLALAAVTSMVLAWGARLPSRFWSAVLLISLATLLVVLWPPAARAWTSATLAFVRAHPGYSVFCAIAVMAAVTTAAVRRGDRDMATAPRSLLAGAAMAALLARPLVGIGLPEGERVNLVAAVKAASAIPSVLDGSRYYETVSTTILPPLPVPSAIVEDIRARLPPRQILVGDPRYSCSLAALVDAYCVNPDHVYGQYYLGARRYQLEYVHSIDGSDFDWHPFFNDTWPIEDRERRFLQDYSVTYLLADPAHADLIARKLALLQPGAVREYSRDGYVLYRLQPHP